MNYFRIDRAIVDHAVFAHPVALKIWIWFLSKATYKERSISVKIGKGETIVNLKPGQFIFGRFKAEEALNIDGSAIYRWMQKFASSEWELIEMESNNQYTIVTICNWDKYQNVNGESEQPTNNQRTTNEPDKNNQRTTNEHKQERKQSIKRVKGKKDPFTPPSFDEVKNYFDAKGYNNSEKFFEYYNEGRWNDAKGNPVRNWKQKAISTWFKPENIIQSETNGNKLHKNF
jgi:hypothetical protein